MATASKVPQDQKKRSLEALERRFASAQAELALHQKKTTISSNVEDGKTARSTDSSKKGNFTFSGYFASEDVDKNDPTYSNLSHEVHENLLMTNVQLSGKKESKVDKVLHHLLQNGDSAQKYMQGSRSKKIDNVILLDNYVPDRSMPTGSRLRALQTHSKRSKKHMSMRQHKKHGTFDWPQDLLKYEKFKPMHEMWKDYMTRLLKGSGKNQLAQCLMEADLHGAIILVVECKVTSYTGVSGIMIRETAETLGIITEDDKFRVVPKKFSVFVFQVDCWKVTLQGDKLTSRDTPLSRQF